MSSNPSKKKLTGTITSSHTRLVSASKQKVSSKQNATDQQAQEQNTNFEKELKEKDEAMKQLQEKCKSLQEQIDRQKSFKQYGEQPRSEQFKMQTAQRLPSVSDSSTVSTSALSVRGPGDDDSVIVADNTELLAEISFAGDADEHIKDPCAVCFTDRNYSKEATHFCWECGLLGHFLCEQCLSFHKKFTAHKDVKSFVAAKYKMRQKKDIGKRTAPTDNKLADITRKLNEASQKYKEAESKVEELKNQVCSKEKEIQDLNRKIADGKSENEGLKEKIYKLRKEEQLKSKNEEIESLKKDLETLKRNEAQQLKSKNEETESLRKELETLKSDNAKLKVEKQTTEKEEEKHLKEIRALKDDIAQLQKQKIAGDKTRSTSSNTDKDLQKKYEQTYKELNDAKTEISELKNRLSQAVDAKLMDNNPNIANLSDENWPTKLAEKYSELYDNEWTDAYEEVEKELPNEQDVIKHLYQSLLDVFDICQKSSQEYSKSLKSCALGLPSLTVENGTPKTANIGVTHVRQLKEMKKSFSPFLVEDVIKNYVKNINLKLEKKPKTENFISKCVEICWLMSSQDPPVILDTVNVKGPFDSDRYRTYTKTGKTVDFVVWPPMLLHKDGPLLSKGVAQGK